MAKNDIADRIKKGIQPGVIANLGKKANESEGNDSLLTPSFDSIMNSNMSKADSSNNKHAIGTKPSLMNKFNNK